MFTLFGDGQSRTCEGTSRREFLQVGSLSIGGLSLASLLATEAKAAGGFVRDKAVVVLNLQGGPTYGASDDFAYKPAENPVHVHDFQATVLHLLGIDHERLTYKFQGRRFRLTDVHGKVIEGVLA